MSNSNTKTQSADYPSEPTNLPSATETSAAQTESESSGKAGSEHGASANSPSVTDTSANALSENVDAVSYQSDDGLSDLDFLPDSPTDSLQDELPEFDDLDQTEENLVTEHDKNIAALRKELEDYDAADLKYKQDFD